MIAVIDYDMGNLRSVQKALEKVGAVAAITRDPQEILSADGVVLPGVGAFGLCMDHLREYGLIEPIKDYVASDRPFLGICLGMQLLFEESEEFGRTEGLGILKGRVVRFPEGDLKVPHMGWNALDIKKPDGMLKGVKNGDYFYFVHSYYVEPDEEVTAAVTDYGRPVTAAVERGNLFAAQFHPEKSQHVGLTILENFTRRVSQGG